jgi:dimethylhistidine N-methyltransferase
MDTVISINDELAAGLLADHACIAPKYFYDTLGSILFEAICVLPEYYLTRTEASILQRYQNEIAQAIPSGSTLIDLGAGNCAKAARLFSVIHPQQYVAIDISLPHVTNAVQHLQQRFPHIEMTALGRDFSLPWALPHQIRNKQRLFFYPGSSIGNFQPEAACPFLRQLRTLCDEGGGVLIGIDLLKDPAVLNAAYNDSLGVTAAFNLNALHHVNRLLGTDFDVNQWRHLAFFNEEKSRVEMHLEARTNLIVSWDNERRHFRCGERIHTEHSYKYSLSSFLALLASTGFQQSGCWTDEKEWYAVIYAKVTQ